MKNGFFRRRAQLNNGTIPPDALEEDPISTEDEAPSRATSDERALLLRMQAGEERAWEEFMDQWNKKLYSYMLYNMPTEDDAKDVLSETMTAFVHAIKTFDGNVNLSTFIYSIAYRKVADFWRRSKSTVILPETLSIAGPTTLGVEVEEALATLSDIAQHALLLRYQAGLSVAEVAEVLGRSYKATESLLSRVRQQFHHAFLGVEA